MFVPLKDLPGAYHKPGPNSPLSASAAQWLHITDLGGQVRRQKQTAPALWGFQSLGGGEGQCMSKLQILALNNVGENTISMVVSVGFSWRRCHLMEALNSKMGTGWQRTRNSRWRKWSRKNSPWGSRGLWDSADLKRGKLCRSYWMFLLRPHTFLASLPLPQWG